MKIYTGLVLDINDREWVIIGQQKIRKTTWYILKSGDDKRSLERSGIIARMEEGSIKYIRSEAV